VVDAHSQVFDAIKFDPFNLREFWGCAGILLNSVSLDAIII
jgi:hypothetical protein